MSWWNMHRAIARSEERPGHFAYKNRNFYAHCDVGAYYERFARLHMNYPQHLRTAGRLLPPKRLVVVSQERMARDIDSVVVYLKALARGEDAQLATPSAQAAPHVSYADSTENIIPVAIRNELNDIQKMLYTAIEDSGVPACL